MKMSIPLITLPVHSVQIGETELRKCLLDSPGLLNNIILSVENDTWQNWQAQRELDSDGMSGPLLENIRRYVNSNPDALQDIFVCAGKSAWQECLQAIFDDNHYTQMFLKVFAIEVRRRPHVQRKISKVIKSSDNNVNANDGNDKHSAAPPAIVENLVTSVISENTTNPGIPDDNEEFIVIDDLDLKSDENIKVEFTVAAQSTTSESSSVKIEPVLSQFMDLFESHRDVQPNISSDTSNDVPLPLVVPEQQVVFPANEMPFLPVEELIKMEPLEDNMNDDIEAPNLVGDDMLCDNYDNPPEDGDDNIEVVSEDDDDDVDDDEILDDDDEGILASDIDDSLLEASLADTTIHDDILVKKEHNEPSFNSTPERNTDLSSNTNKHECAKCDEHFGSVDALNKHDQTHHKADIDSSKDRFECSKCDKSYWKISHLHRHMRGIHAKDRKYLCRPCGKSYSEKSDYDHHVKIHRVKYPTLKKLIGSIGKTHQSRPGVYYCKHCDKTFKFRNNAGWEKHQLLHSPSRRHVCSLCNRRFASLKGLSNHVKRHDGEQPFKCHFCENRYKNNFSLRKHERAHHPQNLDLKCENCDRIFIYAQTLTKHRKFCYKPTQSPGETVGANKNVGAASFECPVCSKKFPKQRNLKIHMFSHRNSCKVKKDTFRCINCGVSFSSKVQFDKHKLTCDAKTSRRSSIGTESKTSTEGSGTVNDWGALDEPYQCTVCQNTFSDLDLLKKHILMHKGKKASVNSQKSTNLKCDEAGCKKSFKTYGEKVAHFNAAHKGKSYKCTLCTDSFQQWLQLQSHMEEIHKKMEKPFSCPFENCNACYLTKASLLRHNNTMHSGQVMPEELSSVFKKPCSTDSMNLCISGASSNSDLESMSTPMAGKRIASPAQSPSSSKSAKRQSIDLSPKSDREDLTAHGDNRGRVYKFECGECGSGFGRKDKLFMHMQTKHGIIMQQCDQCTMKFVSDVELSVHKLVHAGVMSFSCSICNKSFKSEGSRSIHIGMCHKESKLM